MSIRVSNLTKLDAEIRTKAEYTNIQYNCYLDLKNNDKDEYRGLIEVLFDIKTIDKVFINFCGKEIESLVVNGNEVDLKGDFLEKNWIHSNLYLPNEMIKNQGNNVLIKFNNLYSTDGDGLCLTFGVDKLKYKYTQTEPFGLNRIFPVFDQPDMKGKVKYYFSGSEDDNIITTEYKEHHFTKNSEIDETKLDCFGKKVVSLFKSTIDNLWVFGNSKHLSSYLFGFSVGPFQEFKLDLAKFKRGIPISVYCRKSMAKFMEKQIENIFFPMMEGILVYEEFFGINYPFCKNDLIFLPEYKVGAMEYPGCITINEIYVFQDEEIPPIRTLTRSHTIYHELAHMWFGNLVTMKWWDDLWLNESFAELISVMIMKGIKDKANTIDYDTDIMLRLDWGLKTDEKKSTHPISCNITDTSMAESIFDGISYSKGPGVLKQLVYLIGLDKFKQNIKNYFQKYQWKNTDLNMFLEEMGNGLNIDIKLFNEDFIGKACLNTLNCVRKENGIEITQGFVLEEFNYLRNHKFMVAFFDKNCELIEKKDLMIEKVENKFFEIEKDLLDKTEVIFINYDFNAWVRFNLDQRSNDFIIKNVEKFKKYSLNFRNFLSNYFNLVRDSKLKSVDYLNNILNILHHFKNDQVMLSEVLPCLLGSISFYMPKEIQKENYLKLNKNLYELMENHENPVIAKKLFDYYVSTSKEEENILSLKSFLDNSFSNKKIKLLIEDKWGIYFKLMAKELISDDLVKSYFEKLNKEDETDSKFNYKILIDGFKANKEERAKLFEVYKDGKSKVLNYSQKQYSISGYTSEFLDENIRNDYYEKYFESIVSVFKDYGYENGMNFLHYLSPGNYKIDDSIVKLENLLNNLNENEESIKRSLVSKIEDLKRIQKHLNLYK